MNHKGVSITAGGSQLVSNTGETIVRDIVDVDISTEVAIQIIQYDLRCLLLKDTSVCESQYVLVGDAPLHPASIWWFETLGISVLEVLHIDDDPWPEHTLRAGAVADKKQLLPIASRLEVSLAGKAKLQHWSAVTCSEATGSSTHLLEVFGKSVDKWNMLKHHLGESIDPSKIIAIGDGLNDIEVFQQAGFSIVMDNADENVQQYADVIAGRHDEDGFAEAMRRWILPSCLEME
jgi:hydroxymethylpyrimidine pyrophosphatase-like HAD family hydrolase